MGFFKKLFSGKPTEAEARDAEDVDDDEEADDDGDEEEADDDRPPIAPLARGA